MTETEIKIARESAARVQDLVLSYVQFLIERSKNSEAKEFLEVFYRTLNALIEDECQILYGDEPRTEIPCGILNNEPDIN